MKNTNIVITQKQTNSAIVIFITSVILVIFNPFFSLAVGWLVGFITKVTVGDWCVTALNTLLRMDYTKEMLPNIGAALGWLGGILFRLKLYREAKN